jgi:hypothetical protein
MSIRNILTDWRVSTPKHEKVVRKYSITSDILSFKRCKKQYGYFTVRGFVSATATQRFFGTLVHDVLDSINRDYKLTKELPSRQEIKDKLDKAHQRLRASGVRAYNEARQVEKAERMISNFVELVGHPFFSNITKTEYELKNVMKTPNGLDYMIGGVVDILAGAASHDLGLLDNAQSDDVEIWDYKSGNRNSSKEFLKDYQYQMMVYAELYKQQMGKYPSRCVLVFLGEVDMKDWESKKHSIDNFKDMFYILDFSKSQTNIQDALKDFHSTVEQIEAERSKPFGEQWSAPTHNVDEDTCVACEIRYNCEKFPQGSKQKNEPL